jgi:hypothetical protein
MRRFLILVPLALLTACGGGGDEARPSTPAVTSAPASSIPSPSQPQAGALLGQLAGVSSTLNDTRSVSRARDLCSQILGGVTADKLVSGTVTRFSGDASGQITDAQAQQVVDIVRSAEWCR